MRNSTADNWFEAGVLTFGCVVPILWIAMRPRLIATSAGLTVVGVFRSVHVPWGAVTRAEPGYGGARLWVTGRSRPITVWAVQRPNYELMLRRPGRSVAILHDISDLSTRLGYGPIPLDDPAVRTEA